MRTGWLVSSTGGRARLPMAEVLERLDAPGPKPNPNPDPNPAPNPAPEPKQGRLRARAIANQQPFVVTTFLLVGAGLPIIAFSYTPDNGLCCIAPSNPDCGAPPPLLGLGLGELTPHP